MRIVFTILFYLIGVQASLSASPSMTDPNICSSEEKKADLCELHCISKGLESKLLSFENIIPFVFFNNYNSLNIKRFILIINVEPKSNSPPKFLV